MPLHETLNLTDLPASTWRTSVTIRFGHCDPAGIVYTPNYFDIFNGLIEDWYSEALHLSYSSIIRDRRIGLGYAHASADFLSTSRMGDVLRVAVVVKAIGRSSLTLSVHAFNGEPECVRATFVSVTTSLETHRPVLIPDDIRAAIERYRDGTLRGH